MAHEPSLPLPIRASPQVLRSASSQPMVPSGPIRSMAAESTAATFARTGGGPPTLLRKACHLAAGCRLPAAGGTGELLQGILGGLEWLDPLV